MERVTSLAFYLREIIQLRERVRTRDAQTATLQAENDALRQELNDERDAARGMQKAFDNKCKLVERLTITSG